MIVGLTGGIGTGKSTVSNMLRDLGAYVVDADVWARRVVEPGSEGLSEIVAAFGVDILDETGALNRKKLGQVIFYDPSKRQTLNEITHPRVRRGMRDETLSYLSEHQDEPVVWDVPLLFEGDTKKLVDYTILVYTSPETQKVRLMGRDGLNESDASARIQSQMPIDEKRALATFIIDNGGSLEKTREQVECVWNEIRSRTKDPSSLS